MRESAGWISGRRRDDTHPGGRTVPWEGQQAGFPGGDEMTHKLVAEQCHRRVSRLDFQRRQTTHILVAEQHHGRVSRLDFREEKTDNTHPGGRTAPWEGQQAGFPGGDETTHILVAEQHHGRVSRLDFREEMRQRTSWWQNSTIGGSAGWISGRR